VSNADRADTSVKDSDDHTEPYLPALKRMPPTLGIWRGLTRFLEDGRLELDTNPVENQIRPIALTRKNALFAGHEIGAENWAMLASLVATCKMSDVNRVDYLAHTLHVLLDGHPKSRIEELMLWRFRKASSLAA
jgi:transposase